VAVLSSEQIRRLATDLRDQGTDTTRVEAKAARRAVPRSLYDTLSSFANTHGGFILLGVHEEDDFAIVGVEDAAKVAQDLSSMCSEMTPVLHPEIEIVEVDGAQVVVADIDALRSEQRPCFRTATGAERGTFLRRFDGDVRATPSEVQLMLAERRQPQEDLRPVHRASLQDLDGELIDGLIARVAGRRAFTGLSSELILRQLNAVVEMNGRLVPTVGGLLALGRYPQQFLGRTRIEYVRHPTEERRAEGVRMERSEVFEGPIPHMVRDTLNVLSADLPGAIVISDGEKRTLPQYPRDALREAIANALAHRDLREGVGEATVVEVFPDRLVVRNPGGLYGLREEDLADPGSLSRSVARNQALMKLLEDTPDPSGESVVESRATGIPTMLRAMREAGMAPPRFRDELSFFQVDFPKHTLLDPAAVEWLSLIGADDLTQQQQIALAMARRGDRIDNSSYRQATGVADPRAATRHLAQLVERDLLRRHETKRWAYYTLGASAAPGDGQAPLEGFGEALERQNGGAKRRGDRRPEIMGFLTTHKEASTAQISQHLGIGPRAARKWLRQLADEGKIAASDDPPNSPRRRWVFID
jgi:ATP-dependent DNA helicase RecG